MAQLTTHVLDTAGGQPAANVPVRLFRAGRDRRLVTETRTNADGRTDAPLMAENVFEAGTYEIEFDVGAYFAGRGAAAASPFLDTVLIRVTLAADETYHVPLLVSPWSYSTYRGS